MGEPEMVTFIWRCPKGHGPTFSYEPKELRGELDNGTLKYFCGMCGEFYMPNEEEKRNLRQRMEEALKNG